MPDKNKDTIKLDILVRKDSKIDSLQGLEGGTVYAVAETVATIALTVMIANVTCLISPNASARYEAGQADGFIADKTDLIGFHKQLPDSKAHKVLNINTPVSEHLFRSLAHIQKKEFGQALTESLTIEDPFCRTNTLRLLILHLDEDGKKQAIKDGLAAAQEIKDKPNQVYALSAWALHLSDTRKSETLSHALKTALEVDSPEQNRVLYDLAPQLNDIKEEITQDSYDQVIKAIKQKTSDYDDNGDEEKKAQALVSQLEELRKNEGDKKRAKFKALLKSKNDDERIEAVLRLAEKREKWALRMLVREWAQWIAKSDEALLGTYVGVHKKERDLFIEEASEAMHNISGVALLLINQLSQNFPPDADLDKFIQEKIQEKIQKEKSTVNRESEREISNLSEREAENQKIELFTKEDIRLRNLRVHQAIAKQLADMSNPDLFMGKKDNKNYKEIHDQLKMHAVSDLARRLRVEKDLDIRKNLTYALGYIGGREAIGALARTAVGEERKQNRRQALLDEYYLKPSNKRSEEAAKMLKEALDEAKRTLRILQYLNIALFFVGLSAIVIGLIMVMNGDNITKLVGFLSSMGGLLGVFRLMIHDPLDRIQNSMSDLVQLEAAFTSFIWELNLNSTYIQSQYVAKGELSNDDIAQTVDRIEGAMQLTLHLVQAHTEKGGPRIVTRIRNLSPASDRAESIIIIHGQYLEGDGYQKKKVTDKIRGKKVDSKGIIAINHTPIQAKIMSWKDNEIIFKLPAKLPNIEAGKGGVIVISLFIDGMETNALPFYLVEKAVSGEI